MLDFDLAVGLLYGGPGRHYRLPLNTHIIVLITIQRTTVVSA